MKNRREMGGWGAIRFDEDFQKKQKSSFPVILRVLIDDHLYSAILRSLEQTHCTCMWFYMSD